MAAQLLISLILTLSIVASGWLLANAEKSDAPSKPPAQAAQSKAPEKSTTKPGATENTTPSAGKQTPPPVLMELSTSRDFFHAKDDILVKAELWAIQPVTLCVYPNHPEANFTADVYRAGYGKLDAPPSVVQLNRQDLMNVDRVKLEPGQTHRMVFNVKKLVPLPPKFWKTGEYRVQVKFYLCGKTEQEETAIRSQGPLHLLVLE